MTKLVVLTKQEVADIVGVSQSTITRWVHSNRFPKPIKIGGSLARCWWTPEAIDQFIEELKNVR